MTKLSSTGSNGSMPNAVEYSSLPNDAFHLENQLRKCSHEHETPQALTRSNEK